jgi:hypothetical protein
VKLKPGHETRAAALHALIDAAYLDGRRRAAGVVGRRAQGKTSDVMRDVNEPHA